MAPKKTAATKAAKALTLADLRTSRDTLYVANRTNTVVTCTVGQMDFQLEPTGRPDSIKVLPPEIAQQPGFQRLWLRKRVEVSDDPSMEEKISLLVLGQDEADQARTQQLVEMTESESGNADLVERKCLVSGEMIFQTIQQVKDKVPPLAPQFVDEADDFKSVEIDGPNGPETTFVRVGKAG